jgi:thioredoxin reductase
MNPGHQDRIKESGVLEEREERDRSMRHTNADVVIVGAGTAGLYAGLVLKRGIPTDAPTSLRVLVLDRAAAGGLARFGYITFSKRWAFPGSRVITALREEVESIGVEIQRNSRVVAIRPSETCVTIDTLHGSIDAKYVIVATGIVPAPEAITHNKVLIGLGDEARMKWDLSHKGWQKVILYGNNLASLEALASTLEHIVDSTTICCATDDHLQAAVRLATASGAEPADLAERLPGLSAELVSTHDGVMLDYNSYKAWNGSTGSIAMPDVATDHGYIRVNPLGRTTSPRVYAAGNVCTPASGVLPAMSSALTAALAVGQELAQSSSDRDRFPWFPRLASFEDSWLVELANEPASEAEVLS